MAPPDIDFAYVGLEEVYQWFSNRHDPKKRRERERLMDELDQLRRTDIHREREQMQEELEELRRTVAELSPEYPDLRRRIRRMFGRQSKINL